MKRSGTSPEVYARMIADLGVERIEQGVQTVPGAKAAKRKLQAMRKQLKTIQGQVQRDLDAAREAYRKDVPSNALPPTASPAERRAAARRHTPIGEAAVAESYEQLLVQLRALVEDLDAATARLNLFIDDANAGVYAHDPEEASFYHATEPSHAPKQEPDNTPGNRQRGDHDTGKRADDADSADKASPSQPVATPPDDFGFLEPPSGVADSARNKPTSLDKRGVEKSGNASGTPAAAASPTPIDTPATPEPDTSHTHSDPVSRGDGDGRETIPLADGNDDGDPTVARGAAAQSPASVPVQSPVASPLKSPPGGVPEVVTGVVYVDPPATPEPKARRVGQTIMLVAGAVAALAVIGMLTAAGWVLLRPKAPTEKPPVKANGPQPAQGKDGQAGPVTPPPKPPVVKLSAGVRFKDGIVTVLSHDAFDWPDVTITLHFGEKTYSHRVKRYRSNDVVKYALVDFVDEAGNWPQDFAVPQRATIAYTHNEKPHRVEVAVRSLE